MLGGQSSQLDVELGQMSAGNLFVEFLRKHVDAEWEVAGPGPESNLSEDLVGERARHDEGGVSGCASIKRVHD